MALQPKLGLSVCTISHLEQEVVMRWLAIAAMGMLLTLLAAGALLAPAANTLLCSLGECAEVGIEEASLTPLTEMAKTRSQ